MKVGVVSLGCPKNRVDTEMMIYSLENSGYQVTNDSNEAEAIIINTCGFVDTAKQESIDTILEMSGHKSGKCRYLVVAGCLGQRYAHKILEEIPEVDAVTGICSHDSISGILRSLEKGHKNVLDVKTPESHVLQHRHPGRKITTGPSYAYLKIAEGCSNRCTYCAIPSIRGPYRSRRYGDIAEEAAWLGRSGFKEIIVTAQDTTAYGADLHEGYSLAKLLDGISRINEIEWIRLLYCYPDEIDDELMNTIAANDKICKYLDIPIQHASSRILKAMGRRGDAGFLEDKIMNIRSRTPGIVLRTSIIVGFPSESEKDFSILYDFVKRMRFERLGVFRYSSEEDTPAADLRPKASARTAQYRYDLIMELQQGISRELNQKRAGKVYRTIIDGVCPDKKTKTANGENLYYGRTFAETPEIDGLVFVNSATPLTPGEFTNVKITDVLEYDLIGVVNNESAK